MYRYAHTYNTPLNIHINPQTREAYDKYCDLIRNMYLEDFWRIFATVYTERKVTIDKVLKGCKDVFVRGTALKVVLEAFERQHVKSQVISNHI